MSGGLSIAGLSKRFGDLEALAEAAFSIAPGEVLAVTGPSGAGKTTLCRLIAGLERPDAGRLSLGGLDLAGVPARARRIAFLFESYALYPHMSVVDNVASPLRAPNAGDVGEAEIARRVDALITALGIGHLGARLPSELSGGQKQRVGLARALAQTGASATLLDEPISHLDAKLRHRLRGEIRRMLGERDAPALWSTPDGLEALAVGDRVAVLIDGRIAQIGRPAEIWTRPADIRVARLIGDPPMTLLDGAIESEGETAALRLACGAALALPSRLAAALARAAGPSGLTLGVMPRAFGLSPDEAGGDAEVVSVEPFGKHALITARLGASALRAKTPGASPLSRGQRVRVALDPEGVVAFDRASGRLRPLAA